MRSPSPLNALARLNVRNAIAEPISVAAAAVGSVLTAAANNNFIISCQALQPKGTKSSQCLRKTRHPIVIVISSNPNQFSKFFHCWKVG